jgi:hypothetical protein
VKIHKQTGARSGIDVCVPPGHPSVRPSVRPSTQSILPLIPCHPRPAPAIQPLNHNHNHNHNHNNARPGSLTYMGTMLASRSLSPAREGRQLVATLFVLAWALRLGSFLFTRVVRVGKDSRFDGVKDRPLLFLQ